VLTGIKGKVALITGGASGMGKATAFLFAKEGAKVVIADTDVVGGREVAREIRRRGGEAIAIKTDVSKEKQAEAMVAKAVAKFGTVDFAFNSAGVGPENVTIPNAPMHEYEKRYWDKIIDINLTGVWLSMKYEIRQMRKQGNGVIVNNSSMSSLMPGPEGGSYGPTKVGVNYLARQVAYENKDMGIRAHSLATGMIRNTGMTDRLWASSDKRGVPRPLEENAGEPDDVANVVVWLCSDEAAFVNASVIAACGKQFIL
jgi:NAD(P)-dependent dehydrogenase (short-subunit alcohol dehydrogenase family)